MYKNYKDEPSTLVPEDQFMMKVSCFVLTVARTLLKTKRKKTE